jgi:hypothetical protein
MFIGHFGLGFGAKRVAPAPSLGTLFIASQLADLLWPTLVLLGVETVRVQPGATVMTPLDFVSYPYSHSLLALAIWGALFAGAYRVLRRGSSALAALTLGALVVSHWVLDVIVHRPDLPLTFTGDARFGLGLWNSLPGTLTVELAIFLAGVVIYARCTAARDRVGSYALWGLVGFLLVVYFANVFGPPPPSAPVVAWSAEAMWLLVVWGYWVDRHRTVRVGSRR